MQKCKVSRILLHSHKIGTKKIWVDFPLIDDAKVNKLTLIGRLEQIIQLKWFAVLFTLTLHWNSVMEKFSQNKFKFDHQFKLDC